MPTRLTTSFRNGLMVAVGTVLLTKAMTKAVDPRDAITSLTYVFGAASALPLLRFLVVVEILLGAALVTVLAPRLVLPLTVVLFAAFSGWIAFLWATGAPVSCGCGGTGSAPSKPLMLARTLFLLMTVTLTMVSLFRAGAPRITQEVM